MSRAALEVHAWPQAGTALEQMPGLLLISVATADTTIRDAARKQIRVAVCYVMARQLGVPVDAIELIAIPGQPPRLLSGTYSSSLSISHEAGLSVAAVRPFGSIGSVGIDILRVDSGFDWHDVARDYLEPDAAQRIIGSPTAKQTRGFAKEWTRLEARLKCLGMGLEERTEARDKKLQGCQAQELKLPDGYVGHVAWQASANLP